MQDFKMWLQLIGFVAVVLVVLWVLFSLEE
jgi:hypothetical protein